MYAIVDIAGQQFKVEKGQEIFVNRLAGEEGDKVNFEDVLLIDNNGKVTVGAPVVEGATVAAKIIDHLKGDKVLVFKKKRRKGYKKTQGHRDYLTRIIIEDIKVGAKKAAVKEEKKEDKTEPVKKEKAAPAKKQEPKKSAAKKPAAVKKTTKTQKEEKTAAKTKTTKPETTKPETKKKTAGDSAVKKESRKPAPEKEKKEESKEDKK